MSSPSIITKDTLIPIGALIIVLSAAFSYGVMYQKVENLTVQFEKSQKEYTEDNLALRNEMKEMNSKLDQLIGRANSLTYEQ